MIYGGKLLYNNVQLNIREGRRYAIVGANGAGKSTLLKLISGQEEPTAGDILKPKGATIGWMQQDQYRYKNNTLVDVVLQGRPELWQALQARQTLLANEDWDEATVAKFSAVEEKIAFLDGYAADSQAHQLLTGLGLEGHQHAEPLSQLSGGYKLRVLLAQALYSNPTVLLLDEPTNHLDMMTINWLEQYLIKQYQGLLVFISHDRDFIDNVATDILDIDYGEIQAYPGVYTKFEAEKAEVVERKLHETSYLQAKIDNMQRMYERFRAKPSKSKQAMSRLKMIERIELPEIKKSSRTAPSFLFKMKRPSGKCVLKMEKIAKQFAERQLFSDLNVILNRGDKVVLIGHNGVGKSTLLKILLGHEATSAGAYEWGYETHIAYFSQNHHDLLKGNGTAETWLAKMNPAATPQAIRNVLGQMLFSGEDSEKLITHLSGGEAARLLFANVILQDANILVLDEPTNHLDLEASEALADTLQKFQGTVICVSHNRHFVAKVATRVLALTEQGLLDHLGDYPSYLTTYGADYLSQSWLKANK